MSALRRFHKWNYDPLSDCHMTTHSYFFLLPCVDEFSFYMWSLVWKVGYELEIPIGSMILPTFHVACFRRNNGQPMISKLHLFPSCGRSYLESLNFWRRNFMVYMLDGVAWVSLEDHYV